MADNVNVSPSGSTPIATDDIAGVQFQKVKLNLGTDNIDGGVVSEENPLPTRDITMVDLYNLFAYMADRLEYGMSTDNAKRLKVNLSESGALPNVTTVGTVTTVAGATVTDQNLIGGIQAKRAMEWQMDTAYNVGFMSNITF